MSHYQVIARKYRPRSFGEVLGQEAIVTTLMNAIAFKRLAHAYLFCGSRGTGKTTLARVFAKALNCQNPSASGEPCSLCSSCKEIAVGSSLDVIEIDGASHRGIDDVRQINDTVGFAPTSGKYKIYIIDEVHMLTKEAFNALLKTLEEPPPNVIFLFATTEPHKVLPTILSRCQRFNLSRIPQQKIIEKLKRIAADLHVEVEEEALRMIAQRAEGGLRDAESLFDQILAFHEGKILSGTVSDVLGIVSKDILFDLDVAGKEGRLAMAFEVTHQMFSQGKDMAHFVDTLTDHFRSLLLVKLSGISAPFLTMSDADKQRYEASSKLYTQEQCLSILDFLVESQSQMRFQSGKIAIEAILLRIMRTHQQLSIDTLVRRLVELEQSIQQNKGVGVGSAHCNDIKPQPQQPAQQKSTTAIDTAISSVPVSQAAPLPPPPPQPAPLQTKPVQIGQIGKKIDVSSMTEDPSPTAEDLGHAKKKSPPPEIPSPAAGPAAVPFSQPRLSQPRHRYDTLLQFAAIELEGKIQKN